MRTILCRLGKTSLTMPKWAGSKVTCYNEKRGRAETKKVLKMNGRERSRAYPAVVLVAVDVPLGRRHVTLPTFPRILWRTSSEDGNLTRKKGSHVDMYLFLRVRVLVHVMFLRKVRKVYVCTLVWRLTRKPYKLFSNAQKYMHRREVRCLPNETCTRYALPVPVYTESR